MNHVSRLVKSAALLPILVSVAFLFLSSEALSQEATVTLESNFLIGTVTAEALNVRSGPGANYATVGVLYKGDAVNVLARNQDGSWLSIAKGDLKGWVSAKYVEVQGDISTLPVAAAEAATPVPGEPSPPSSAATPSPMELCIARANPEASYKEVKKSDRYIGQTVAWKGEVFNIRETQGKTWFQAWYFEGRHLSEPDDAFVVTYDGVLPGVYEDTEVLVCGVVGEPTEGTNAFGALISQPTIVAEYVELWKPPSGSKAQPPTPTPVPLLKESAVEVEHKSGIWTHKLTDVKRAKAVYFFGEATIATGTFLIPLIEFRNDGSGTAEPIHNFDFYLQDEMGRTYDFDPFGDAVLGASWQFQMGHLYDDINPGLVLGIALPFDVPPGLGDVWLRDKQNAALVIYLGNVSQLPESQ
jgi:hypothetical protein